MSHQSVKTYSRKSNDEYMERYAELDRREIRGFFYGASFATLAIGLTIATMWVVSFVIVH